MLSTGRAQWWKGIVDLNENVYMLEGECFILNWILQGASVEKLMK